MEEIITSPPLSSSKFSGVKLFIQGITSNLLELASRLLNKLKSKKILIAKITLGLLVAALVLGIGLFVWSRDITAKLAVRRYFSVELPADADYKNLTLEQYKDLLAQISAKHPEQGVEDGLFIQDVVITQNGKPIPYGQTPPKGDINIDPTKLGDSDSDSYDDPEEPDGPTDSTDPTGPVGGVDELFPCDETDDGKDLYTQGTITDMFDNTFTDNCTGPYTLNEYWCQEGMSYDLGWFDCPNGCSDGACVYEGEDKPDPLEEDTKCSDTDKGKNYYEKGTLTTLRGISQTDVCIDKTTLTEFWCAEGTSYTAQQYDCPQGCDDGACVGSESEPDDSEDIAANENEPYVNEPFYIEYTSHESGSDQSELAEVEAKLQEIKELVHKYFPVLVELYGAPHNETGQTLTIVYSKEFSPFFSYLPQQNAINISNSNPATVVLGLLSAFHGEYFRNIPETWSYGMRYAVASIALNKFPENDNPFRSTLITNIRQDYEKFNTSEFPIWSTNINYKRDLFSSMEGAAYRTYLAMEAFMKVFWHCDNDIFAKLNTQLYNIPTDSKLWEDEKKLFETITAGTSVTVEGESLNTWYSHQHILHQTRTNPILLLQMLKLGQFYVLPRNNKVQVYVFRTDMDDEGFTFVPRVNVKTKVTAYDHTNTLVRRRDEHTSSSGVINFSLDDLSINTLGRYRIEAVTWSNVYESVNHQGYYEETSPPYWHGVVTNFGNGTVKAGGSTSVIEEVAIQNGVFEFSTSFIGASKFEVFDLEGNKLAEKSATSNMLNYFVVIESPTAPNTPTESEEGEAPTVTCGENWIEYESTEQGFKMKYPPDWFLYEPTTADFSAPFDHEAEQPGEAVSGSATMLYLVSTTDSASQLDPYNPLSYFQIATSRSDYLKKQYVNWFLDLEGQPIKATQTTFKNLPAEKYTTTGKGMAGEYYKESYYLQNAESLYTALELGMYITDELKESNQATLQCFLDSFEFLAGRDETGNFGETFKVFESDKLGFQINYPTRYLAHESTSSREPENNYIDPVASKTIVQFFEGGTPDGKRISIYRYTNPQNKSLEDFARSYWFSSGDELWHWETGGRDVVVVKSFDPTEVRTYLIKRGDFVFVLYADEGQGLNGNHRWGVQVMLERMIPTIEFLEGEGGSGMLDCDEQFLGVQNNNFCDGYSSRSVCGYIRHVYEDNREQTHSFDYDNACEFCTQFNWEGFSNVRGTELYVVGYKNGTCDDVGK